jgi:hypothetical protein
LEIGKREFPDPKKYYGQGNGELKKESTSKKLIQYSKIELSAQS